MPPRRPGPGGKPECSTKSRPPRSTCETTHTSSGSRCSIRRRTLERFRHVADRSWCGFLSVSNHGECVGSLLVEDQWRVEPAVPQHMEDGGRLTDLADAREPVEKLVEEDPHFRANQLCPDTHVGSEPERDMLGCVGTTDVERMRIREGFLVKVAGRVEQEDPLAGFDLCVANLRVLQRGPHKRAGRGHPAQRLLDSEVYPRPVLFEARQL